MALATAPQDVVLEVVKRLDLVDLFSFLSVCRAIRELQWQKSLWLHALVRMREVEMQPIPLSNVKQLDSMSRQELQDAARRAVRLKKNLNSDKPTPVKIHALSVESRALCVCLPGSNLLITHSYGFMSCWDLLTSRRVARLEIVGLDVMDNPRFEQDGRALFGAVIGTAQFAAIYIDYQDPDQVSVSYVVSPRTDAVELRRNPGFFMTSDVIGICTSTSTVYWSMEKTSEVINGPAIVPNWEQFDTPSGRCLLFGQNIYILSQAFGSLEASIERHPFPPTSPPGQPTKWMLSVPYPFAEDRLQNATAMFLDSPRPQPPEYGVFAFGHTGFEWGNESTISVVHLWPGQLVSGDIDVGINAVYHATEGGVARMALGRSGSYILILVCNGPIFSDPQAEETGEGYLGLVHVELSPTPHTTFRRLEVDGLPPVSSIHHLALDDSLGRVLVADCDGGLTVLSYV